MYTNTRASQFVTWSFPARGGFLLFGPGQNDFFLDWNQLMMGREFPMSGIEDEGLL